MSQQLAKPSPVRLGLLDCWSDVASTIELAEEADRLGFSRYWLTEHPPQPNPQLLAALVAGLTERIRVGTAGLLLNFHTPLQAASNSYSWSMSIPDESTRVSVPVMRPPWYARRYWTVANFRGNPAISKNARPRRLACCEAICRPIMFTEEWKPGPETPECLRSGVSALDVAVPSWRPPTEQRSDTHCFTTLARTIRRALSSIAISLLPPSIDLNPSWRSQSAGFVRRRVLRPNRCEACTRTRFSFPQSLVRQNSAENGSNRFPNATRRRTLSS